MRWKGIKAKAWEAVKRSVRRREKFCYTCGRGYLIGQNAHSGHYKPVSLVGSNNKSAWNPKFVHLQCWYCNGAGQGMQVEYREHLVLDYGEKIVRQYERDCRKVNPVKDWQGVIDIFNSL